MHLEGVGLKNKNKNKKYIFLREGGISIFCSQCVPMKF
jgi:hypothetical protein